MLPNSWEILMKIWRLMSPGSSRRVTLRLGWIGSNLGRQAGKKTVRSEYSLRMDLPGAHIFGPGTAPSQSFSRGSRTVHQRRNLNQWQMMKNKSALAVEMIEWALDANIQAQWGTGDTV